tara:strand:- start:28612 stop:29460 length:849 start_codon:yes stop_codon:yes gene_type:complete
VQKEFIDVDKGRLFYQMAGEGERDIVWVHGLPLNSNSWYAQVEHFKPNFRNIAIDLRGYGQSSEIPNDTPSVTDLYVADLLTLFNTLKLNKPILVGFASGGHATLKFAAAHGDLISQLVLINASPCFMKQKNWDWGFDKAALDAFIAKLNAADTLEQLSDIILTSAMRDVSGKQKQALTAWFNTMLASAKKETLLSFFNNIAYDDDRSLLKDITTATLIICSRLDKEVPTAVAMYLRENMPNAQLFELNDIDHFGFATQSALVNQVIEQFIQPSCTINLPSN